MTNEDPYFTDPELLRKKAENNSGISKKKLKSRL